MRAAMLSVWKIGWCAAVVWGLSVSSVRANETSSAKTISTDDLSVGLSPDLPKVSGSDTSDGAPPRTVRTSRESWKFGFHGYLRAPMVSSFDTQEVRTYPTNEDGSPDLNRTPTVSEDWRFNTWRNLPDTSFDSWQYTGNLPGPWGELLFSYGNSVASGTVALAADSLTDAGWRNLQSQLGIDRAFVTLEFPHAFRNRGGLTWHAGIFGDRYGGTGTYDAGRYETFIFGRTHTAGETLTAKINLTPRIGLVLEHGFGAKSDVLPDNPRDGDLYGRDAALSFIPFSGAEGAIPSMVHHAHAGVVFRGGDLFRNLRLTGHFIHAFTASADTTNDSDQWPYSEKEGKQLIAGAELRTEGAVFGDLYLGFSTMETDGLARMSDAVEVLHSRGGWSILNNFYGDMVLRESDVCSDTTANCPNPGTGRINTLAWQYDLSLAKLLWYTVGQSFYGQAPDLTFSTWGMVNFVNPDDELEPMLKRWAEKKMKLGVEAMYLPLKYFGFGLRFDRVIPDMDYNQDDVETNMNDSYVSYAPFSVLSPKLTLNTAFVHREEVTLQYSRYFWDETGLTDTEYRNAVRMASSNLNIPGSIPADRNALMIMVTMWW